MPGRDAYLDGLLVSWHVAPQSNRPVILYLQGNGRALRHRGDRFAQLVDRLSKDWASLDKFQRTRGVLRFMVLAAELRDAVLLRQFGEPLAPVGHSPVSAVDLCRICPSSEFLRNGIVRCRLQGLEGKAEGLGAPL